MNLLAQFPDVTRNQILDHLGPLLECRKSLLYFTKKAWPVLLGPNREFQDNWHMGCIAEHLEACKLGQIRNVIFNFPPRHGKSSLISCMLVPWWWLTDPDKQFFYASYDLRLAERDSIQTLRLIKSEWYQHNFGHIFHLMQENVRKLDNNMRGFRACTSTSAAALGHGGDIKVLDDPNLVSIKRNQAETDVKREAVNEFYSGAWSTRVNDPRKDINILSQQRTHENDLTGYILALQLEDETNQEYVHVRIPARFEKNNRCKTIILPSTNGKVWEDPRQEDGELLWPGRWGEKELKTLERSLGNPYRISGQLQQRPSPAEGGILKKGHFKVWKQPEPPNFINIIQSWDPALSAKDYERNSYNACTTWGLFKMDDSDLHGLMHLSSWRGRCGYEDLRKRAIRLFSDYRDTGKEEKVPDKKHIPDLVLVEEKARGFDLIQDLRRGGVTSIAFNPDEFGDKIQRVHRITPLLEAGLIWVPGLAPTYDRLRPYSAELLELCTLFPNSESRDIVDTMVQVLLWLYRGGRLMLPDERDWYAPKEKTRREFYGPDS